MGRGVRGELGAERIDMCCGLGDARIQHVVQWVQNDVLEGVEFGLDPRFFRVVFFRLQGRFGFGRFGVGEAPFLDLGRDVDSEIVPAGGHAGLAVFLEGFDAAGVAGAAGGEFAEVGDGADEGAVGEEVWVLILHGGVVAGVRGRKSDEAGYVDGRAGGGGWRHGGRGGGFGFV